MVAVIAPNLFTPDSGLAACLAVANETVIASVMGTETWHVSIRFGCPVGAFRCTRRKAQHSLLGSADHGGKNHSFPGKACQFLSGLAADSAARGSPRQDQPLDDLDCRNRLAELSPGF